VQADPVTMSDMLIALLIVAGLFLVCGVAVGRAGRDSLRGEIQQLRVDLANVTGARDTLATAYDGMRHIASESLKIAHSEAFPRKTITPQQHTQLEQQFDFTKIQPDYIPPFVANCPRCSVSVREDNWPQECPSCGTCFDEFGKLAGLDADVVIE
jgi:hypothetical protein